MNHICQYEGNIAQILKVNLERKYGYSTFRKFQNIMQHLENLELKVIFISIT